MTLFPRHFAHFFATISTLIGFRWTDFELSWITICLYSSISWLSFAESDIYLNKYQFLLAIIQALTSSAIIDTIILDKFKRIQKIQDIKKVWFQFEHKYFIHYHVFFFLNNAQYCFKNVSSILLFNGIFSFVIDFWRFGLYVIYWIRSSWYDKLIWIKELLCQWIIVDTLDLTHYSPSSGSPNQSVQHHKINNR